MSRLSTGRASRDVLDLIALIAVLTAALLLIILGHMTAGGLVTVCGALVTLYGAWGRFRPTHTGRRVPSGDMPPDDETEVDT